MLKLRQLLLLLLSLMTFTTGNTQLLPTSIPDLLVWHDTQDTTLSQGPLSFWADKSDNNFHLIQEDAAHMPVLAFDPILEKNTLIFNGNEWMLSTFNETKTTPETFFVIYNYLGPGSQYVLDSKNNKNAIIVSAPANSVRAYTLNGASSIEYQRTLPFDYILNTVVVNGGASLIRENGVEMITGNLPDVNFNGLYVGRNAGGNLPFTGNISEVIFYNRALSPQEIELVENYIGNKYGKTIDLGPDITQYGFCDTTLYAPAGFQSYLWSDGSTADSIVASSKGTYWCEVTNHFGAVSRDSIEVNFSPFQYPASPQFCPDVGSVWEAGLGTENFTYLWSDGSTNDNLLIQTEGEVYFTITDTLGCSNSTDTLYFTEDTFPSTASLGGDTDLCVGNILSLSTGAEEAISYLWSTGETTPQIEVSTAGSYSVTVENANGCVAEDEVTINILGDAPVIQFFTPEISCVDADFAFEDLSYTVDGSDVDSWEWQFTDSTSINSATGVYTYDSAGVYTVHYTVGTSVGCFNDSTFTIEIKDNPILDFSTQNSCQTDEIQFNGGQLSPTTIDTWEWNFGDEDSGAANTSTEQITTHHFTNSGTFDVQLVGIDIFGCIDTLVNQKIIDAAPVVDFNYNDACEGNIVYFENQTAIGDSAEISGYQWNFGDGNTSGQTNPNKPYVTHGEFMVSLIAIADNGCSDTLTQLVKIHANPQVDYIMEQPCAGITTVFQDNSFVPNGSVADVDWEFNGGTPINGLAIEKNFNNGGSYNLKQTVKSAFGCNNSKETTVNIHDLIHAGFTVSPNNFVVDEEIVFTSNSIGATSYAWTFGDFATSQQADTSLVFTDEQIGDEIGVTLTVSNEFDCHDSTYLSKTVLGRETDLALSQLFVDEVDGFLKIGVRLKNNGFTPIEKVELTVYRAGIGAFKDTWTGMLNAGENEVYVLNTSPSATVSMQQEQHNYICVNGKLLNNTFEEEDLSNNEVCLSLSKEDLVLLRPFPNPVDDWLNLRLLNTKELTGSLYIYNNQGQMVYAKKDFLFQEGVNDLKIDTKSWSSGSYTIRFVGNVEVPSVRFVKR